MNTRILIKAAVCIALLSGSYAWLMGSEAVLVEELAASRAKNPPAWKKAEPTQAGAQRELLGSERGAPPAYTPKTPEGHELSTPTTPPPAYPHPDLKQQPHVDLKPVESPLPPKPTTPAPKPSLMEKFTQGVKDLFGIKSNRIAPLPEGEKKAAPLKEPTKSFTNLPAETELGTKVHLEEVKPTEETKKLEQVEVKPTVAEKITPAEEVALRNAGYSEAEIAQLKSGKIKIEFKELLKRAETTAAQKEAAATAKKEAKPTLKRTETQFITIDKPEAAKAHEPIKPGSKDEAAHIAQTKTFGARIQDSFNNLKKFLSDIKSPDFSKHFNQLKQGTHEFLESVSPKIDTATKPMREAFSAQFSTMKKGVNELLAKLPNSPQREELRKLKGEANVSYLSATEGASKNSPKDILAQAEHVKAMNDIIHSPASTDSFKKDLESKIKADQKAILDPNLTDKEVQTCTESRAQLDKLNNIETTKKSALDKTSKLLEEKKAALATSEKEVKTTTDNLDKADAEIIELNKKIQDAGVNDSFELGEKLKKTLAEKTAARKDLLKTFAEKQTAHDELKATIDQVEKLIEPPTTTLKKAQARITEKMTSIKTDIKNFFKEKFPSKTEIQQVREISPEKAEIIQNAQETGAAITDATAKNDTQKIDQHTRTLSDIIADNLIAAIKNLPETIAKKVKNLPDELTKLVKKIKGNSDKAKEIKAGAVEAKSELQAEEMPLLIPKSNFTPAQLQDIAQKQAATSRESIDAQKPTSQEPSAQQKRFTTY